LMDFGLLAPTGRRREDWDQLVAVFISADLIVDALAPVPHTQQHQSRPFNIHSRHRSLNRRCCPLINHSLTFTRIRRHSQHCTLTSSYFFIHLVSVRRKRACSILSTNLHTAETRSHSHSNRCQSLVGKQSNTPSLPLLACDKCFNACTPCCTPLGNRKHHTVFTIRRYTSTPWALHLIFPRGFPAGSGRRTPGAAKRNATWALSKAISSRLSMLATAFGGWAGCDATREQ